MTSRAWLIHSDGTLFRRATVEEFRRGMLNNKRLSINGVTFFLVIPTINGTIRTIHGSQRKSS